MLDASDKMHYLKILLEYMDSEKPYLNPSLSISDLSKELSFSTNYISQIINETYGQHFFDFINKYRIQESQNYLKNSNINKMNVLQIAFHVGFNSKSAFNRAFKKHTGQTPTEFRNSQKEV